ncbi:MAG: hypothetical protein C0490_05485, partial [Marivirga sp.]|nr:hypothetical protein [Marivirga sp.]
MSHRSTNFSFRGVYVILLLMISNIFVTSSATAQDKQTIQIKTFDQKLQPLKNVELSLNGKEYVLIGSRGTAIIEMNTDELPIRTIRVKDDKLEAASWNLSKGIVEIIIRPKSYSLIHFVVRYPDGTPVSKTPVSFKGNKILTITTNQSGEFDLPLPLNEKVTGPQQFAIQDMKVRRVNLSATENVIIVDRSKLPEKKSEETASLKNTLQDFDLTRLDSIQSLTVFYAIFKNVSLKDLNEEARLKIDAKFNQLVAQRQDSTARTQSPFSGNITDSSFVAEDIRSLVKHATFESGSLETNRAEFEEKIRLVSNKLEKGVVNFTADERKSLLADLDILEQLLIQNESKFYQNQNDYRDIINSVRQKYFDMQSLETKLFDTEKQREEEQRSFQKRLFGIAAIMIVFGVLIILLITFSTRLRKQAHDLKAANEEIQSINDNLEAIVIKRTKLLEESNKELDTFLYRASHDLRSPVSTILGLCNIFDNIPPSELINRVRGTTVRMDVMLKKLINISEISQQSVDFTTINVLDTINEVKTRQEKLIIDSGVQFHVDCAPDVTIHTNSNLIRSILVNLIENAVFFSAIKNPDHARVEITALLKGKTLELCVYDNGVGIEKAMHPRLFDMFFIGNEMSKGNGLGLYAVQKCVLALSGKIIVESEVGRYS